MKNIIYLIIILAGNDLFGQISNFRNYQEKVNNAEINLVRGNKLEALNVYYGILTTSKGNFCKDVYNAMLLSTELSKEDTFFVFLNMIKTKGLNNKYINEFTEFSRYHKHKKWKQFEKENNNVNINLELKEKIDSLHINDQVFRKQIGSYKVYGDTIKKLDSMNLYYIYSLIKSDKFPGEDEIGVNSIDGSQGYDIVFHHYSQVTSNEENKMMAKLTPLWVNLVLQGKVLPNKCAYWLETQNGEFVGGVSGICCFSINGKETGYYADNYNYERKLLLDEYRKWLCLEPIEEYYEKFLFAINNLDSKYRFDVHKDSYEVDEKVFELMKRYKHELK